MENGMYISNWLLFTAFCVTVFPIYLQKPSTIVLRLSHVWLCKEFQALSFDKNECPNHTDNRGKIFKIPGGLFIRGHPIVHRSTPHRTMTSMRIDRRDKIPMFSRCVAFPQKIGFVTILQHRPTTCLVNYDHYKGFVTAR